MPDTTNTDIQDNVALSDAEAKAARDARHGGDDRSDIERAIDGGPADDHGDETSTMTDPGMPDGVGGTGGVVKNQDSDAQ